MKIRSGFISNSSSSSFIILTKDEWYNYLIPILPKELIIGVDGNTEFGWAFIDYNDFPSKLNWVVLQILYLKECYDYPQDYHYSCRERLLKEAKHWKEYYNRLLKVLKKAGVEKVDNRLYLSHFCNNPETNSCHYEAFGIDCSYYEDNPDNLQIIIGSIDHASTLLENLDLKKIFRTQKNLEKFLFSNESILKTGNDNQSKEDWEKEDQICKENSDKSSIEIKNEDGYSYIVSNPYYNREED